MFFRIPPTLQILMPSRVIGMIEFANNMYAAIAPTLDEDDEARAYRVALRKQGPMGFVMNAIQIGVIRQYKDKGIRRFEDIVWDRLLPYSGFGDKFAKEVARVLATSATGDIPDPDDHDAFSRRMGAIFDQVRTDFDLKNVTSDGKVETSASKGDKSTIGHRILRRS